VAASTALAVPSSLSVPAAYSSGRDKVLAEPAGVVWVAVTALAELLQAGRDLAGNYLLGSTPLQARIRLLLAGGGFLVVVSGVIFVAARVSANNSRRARPHSPYNRPVTQSRPPRKPPVRRR